MQIIFGTAPSDMYSSRTTVRVEDQGAKSSVFLSDRAFLTGTFQFAAYTHSNSVRFSGRPGRFGGTKPSRSDSGISQTSNPNPLGFLLAFGSSLRRHQPCTTRFSTLNFSVASRTVKFSCR